MPRKVGRPSKYCDEIIESICKAVRNGSCIHAICKEKDMPSEEAVYNWLETKPEFVEKYTLAREIRADRMAQEILIIADDTTNDTCTVTSKSGNEYETANHEWINRAKLRVDTRKWLMSKWSPKKYSEKIQQEITGKDGAPVIPVIELSVSTTNKT
jgi:pyruvate carboxylase